MSAAIETRALTRNFGEMIAVDHLDLTIQEGSFFGFLGPNGAGKSTTIRMLTGLIRISSGRASIFGHDVERESVAAKRLIGVVPEELALFDRLTGREFLTFVGRMYDLDKQVIRRRREELLEMMSLAGEPKKLVVDYSHGMQKKLAMAAALIHNPRVLFLDEPFEGIDAVASRMIKDLLTLLVDKGVTILLSSHILEIVENLCSHIGIIHHGRLVAEGSIEELRTGVSVREGVAGVAQDRQRSLEDVFLNLVDASDSGADTLSWMA